jgi:hypothetical protein
LEIKDLQHRIGVTTDFAPDLGYMRWRIQKGMGTARPISIENGTIWNIKLRTEGRKVKKVGKEKTHTA